MYALSKYTKASDFVCYLNISLYFERIILTVYFSISQYTLHLYALIMCVCVFVYIYIYIYFSFFFEFERYYVWPLGDFIWKVSNYMAKL